MADIFKDIAQNRTPTPIDAWSATTPAERLPYAAQIQEAIAEYKADIQAFNARIPLSPLVQFAFLLLPAETPLITKESVVHQAGNR